MDNNLHSVLTRYTIIRDGIFYYLRPTEVSKVCVVVRYLLSDFERKKYMNPMSEIFWNFQQSNTRPTICDCNMILMGDDVKNITNYKYDKIQLCIGVYNYARDLDKYNAEDNYRLFEISMYLDNSVFSGLYEDIKLINGFNDPINARISIYLVLSMVDLVYFHEPPLRLCGMDSNLNSLIREHDDTDIGEKFIERSLYCLTYSQEVCKYETISLRVLSTESLYGNNRYIELVGITPEVPMLRSILRLNDNAPRWVGTVTIPSRVIEITD